MLRKCDRCELEKETFDISDNPIHTETIDICIICKECLEYYINWMKRFIYA